MNKEKLESLLNEVPWLVRLFTAFGVRTSNEVTCLVAHRHPLSLLGISLGLGNSLGAGYSETYQNCLHYVAFRPSLESILGESSGCVFLAGPRCPELWRPGTISGWEADIYYLVHPGSDVTNPTISAIQNGTVADTLRELVEKNETLPSLSAGAIVHKRSKGLIGYGPTDESFDIYRFLMDREELLNLIKKP